MKVSVIGRGMYVEERMSRGWYEEDDPNGSRDTLFDFQRLISFSLIFSLESCERG